MNDHRLAFAEQPFLGAVVVPRAASAPVAEPRVLGLLIAGFAFVYLTYVVEGPLRYGLVLIDQTRWLYLRDLVIELTILWAAWRTVSTGASLLNPVTIALAALGCHLFIGLSHGTRPLAVALGMKIALQFVWGLALADAAARHRRALDGVHVVALLLCLAGLVIQSQVEDLPWLGGSFDTGLGTIGVSKKWWTTGGDLRYSGLARESFALASLLGMSGLWLMCASRNVAVRVGVFAVTLVGIHLTTTKGMLQGFFLGGLWLLLPARGSWKYGAGVVALALLLAIAVVAPLLVVGLDLGYGGTAGVPTVFLSLWDRFQITWPMSISLLDSPIDWITGNGLGAVGTPQMFWFDKRTAVTPDNLFLYMVVTYGAAAVVYMALTVFAVWKLGRTESPASNFAMTISLALASYGVTGNVLENPVAMVVLGMVLGQAAFAPRERAGHA